MARYKRNFEVSKYYNYLYIAAGAAIAYAAYKYIEYIQQNTEIITQGGVPQSGYFATLFDPFGTSTSAAIQLQNQGVDTGSGYGAQQTGYTQQPQYYSPTQQQYYQPISQPAVTPYYVNNITVIYDKNYQGTVIPKINSLLGIDVTQYDQDYKYTTTDTTGTNVQTVDPNRRQVKMSFTNLQTLNANQINGIKGIAGVQSATFTKNV